MRFRRLRRGKAARTACASDLGGRRQRASEALAPMAAPEEVRRSRKAPPAGASAPGPLRRPGRAVRTACPASELQDRTRTRRPTAGQSRFPGQASPPFRLSNFQKKKKNHYARPIGPWFSSSFFYAKPSHLSIFTAQSPKPLEPKILPPNVSLFRREHLPPSLSSCRAFPLRTCILLPPHVEISRAPQGIRTI